MAGGFEDDEPRTLFRRERSQRRERSREVQQGEEAIYCGRRAAQETIEV